MHATHIVTFDHHPPPSDACPGRQCPDAGAARSYTLAAGRAMADQRSKTLGLGWITLPPQGLPKMG